MINNAMKQREVLQEIQTQALAPRPHTSRMRLRHQPQPQARYGLHIVSLRFLGETVDYIERGFCSRRILTIAPQTLLGQFADDSQEPELRRGVPKSDPRALGGNALVQPSVPALNPLF